MMPLAEAANSKAAPAADSQEAILTINSFALGQVVVGGAGQKAVTVATDDALNVATRSWSQFAAPATSRSPLTHY